MASAMVSEITPETKGKKKSRQRSRVRVVNTGPSPFVVWAERRVRVNRFFDAGDAAALAETIDRWADVATEIHPPYVTCPVFQTLYATLVEYASAALDLLTGDTGAEQTRAYACGTCGKPAPAYGVRCCPVRLGMGR